MGGEMKKFLLHLLRTMYGIALLFQLHGIFVGISHWTRLRYAIVVVAYMQIFGYKIAPWKTTEIMPTSLSDITQLQR